MSSASSIPNKLPFPVRTYVMANRSEIPEVLVATLFRTLRGCWICDDERSMKWEVRLPYDQEQICPNVWNDNWRISRRSRGPLLANGSRLETALADARISQAEKDAFVHEGLRRYFKTKQTKRRRLQRKDSSLWRTKGGDRNGHR